MWLDLLRYVRLVGVVGHVEVCQVGGCDWTCWGMSGWWVWLDMLRYVRLVGVVGLVEVCQVGGCGWTC